MDCHKQKKSCIIPFSTLQEEIFTDLLENLTASIQPFNIPPAGPLPNVFKVLQNLFKSMRLGLRDQADLFAATELPITAYEQSVGWSSALVAATQTALTELYAFSLLACVSSPVKDGWVGQIRLAETNLAGISGAVPPVITGTILTLDGGNEVTALSYDVTTLLPSEGAIPGIGFTSVSIPVTTDSTDRNVSVDLTSQQPSAHYYAFSMPFAGTITGMTAKFMPNNYRIEDAAYIVRAQLCRATGIVSPYEPLAGIPETQFLLIPPLTGSTAGVTCQGTLNNISFPLAAEDRLVVVFTISSTKEPTPNSNPTTIQGTLSATLTIVPADGSPASLGPIIPFASQGLITLETNATGLSANGGIVGFGFSDTEPLPPDETPFVVTPALNNFAVSVPNGGTVKSIAAYFGALSGQILSQNLTLIVGLYRYNSSDNTIALIDADGEVFIDVPARSYTESSPSNHGISTGLSIAIEPGTQLVLLFSTILNTTPQGLTLIQGWASGGVRIAPGPP
ncbi:hypothetical protein [Paenibacillus herberti]|uniref:Uncharacterized protein n=1 Tax=Paenibacillus herberti TaxID=1619309 RepID=A0A229P5N2_9BACL|nr:hypothetical protein [Paenibacillus herberti]OXM17215.1 hypothetical protein CGZ75_11580 [Paenibacillus herberti]